MTFTRRWATGTTRDLAAGATWYNEREPGLGAAFVAEAWSVTDDAMQRPFVLKRYEHPSLPADAELRKVQLRRFSEFGVIYTIIGETFWVVAVAHSKRKPGYWIDRLNKLT